MTGVNTPAATQSDQNIAATTDPNVQNGAAVHDLRRLFRSIGSFSGEHGATSVQARSQCDMPVEMLEDAPVRVTGSPLDVAGFVDGIQSSLVLTHREHRPVHLNYTAAAAVDVMLRPLGVQERLEMVVGERDLEWARGLDCTVPLTVVADADPAETQRLAVQGLGGSREQLERALVAQLLAQSGFLVLDGSLVARPVDARLVGVVKTTNRRYLPDESLLYGMQAGWRSPAFRIPAGSQAYPSDRFSCYVRLFDATSRAWDFGLVRVEALDSDVLQGLSALCLQQRQGARNNDPRGDRHLRPVRACEELLRARRPAVFSL
jgi:hypothetical protein